MATDTKLEGRKKNTMSYYDIRQKTEMLGCGAEKEYRDVKLEVNHRETCLYGDIKKNVKQKQWYLN